MIIYNLMDIARKLKIDFDGITSKIEHNGQKGDTREELLKESLAQFIPQKYSIGNGIIVDSNLVQSKQQDFIIYDGFNSPLMLKKQSMQVVPIESVYCTIEIKSTLTKTELEKCVANIKSVRELEKVCLQTSAIVYENANNTIGFVFAYTSDSSLDTIYENLVEMNKLIEPHHQISGICILDKGLILNVSKNGMNQLELYPNKNSTLCCSDNPLENNLYLFYLLILQHLNISKLLPPDLIKYAEKQNAFNIRSHMKIELLPDDGKVNIMDGLTFDVKDVKKINEIHSRMTPFFNGNCSEQETEKHLVENIIPMLETFSKYQTVGGVIGGNNNEPILPSDFEFIKTTYCKKTNNEKITEEELVKYNNLITSFVSKKDSTN
ncbi:MAG: DUF6602 domain-containing protein [Bacilli bacterium]